ncbi:MAG TPA: hypothetical protein VHD85_19330 [Terracidiphilus sp.]|nr:hypothetical protein [Terracidiphilus sp.]
MKRLFVALLLGVSLRSVYAAPISADISAVKPGPIAVAISGETLAVDWKDASNRQWQAQFSLDSSKPLIASISADGKSIVQSAWPYYRCTTGKRTGGWDAFFDFPPANPAGTRQFLAEFHPTSAIAQTVGNRVEVTFDGLKIGIFGGSLRYTFYPGTPLIQQAAIVSATEPDTAYFYDAGFEMTARQDETPGGNMASHFSYYDTDGKLEEIVPPYGSDRHSLTARYRTVAVRMGAGSIAVFPPPHRYFMARDYTTNQGYLWYSSWRGRVGLGIHQYPDDDTTIDPWMNAPPGTKQEMSLFLLLEPEEASSTLKHVLEFTHGDRFVHLDGFVTFEPHWHLAYTVQAMVHGLDWVPPFKPAMKAVGIDSAMIMDFHGDGHPADLTGLRLHELDEYYKACRAQSDSSYLLIPGDEADIYLGGHWGLAFPHPVFWFQDRKPDQPFESTDKTYGKVYRVHNADEMWKMIKQENGLVYETHPRTKGSTGYPDKILDTHFFRDPSYLGTGWKAMPSDLSSPRLGERAFKVLDDLNNLGLHKHMIGEVDVFQISTADELYGHMNINYLRLPALPSFDQYDRIFEAIKKGDGFITTGEVLLPSFSITADSDQGVKVSARVTSTFPLRLAEIVWGDGTTTHHTMIDLQSTPAFDDHQYSWDAETPGWTWARFAVWDVAGDGAFTNPVWRDRIK